jgi:hypothetical protein
LYEANIFKFENRFKYFNFPVFVTESHVYFEIVNSVLGKSVFSNFWVVLGFAKYKVFGIFGNDFPFTTTVTSRNANPLSTPL